jgi:hypothetical protein
MQGTEHDDYERWIQKDVAEGGTIKAFRQMI